MDHVGFREGPPVVLHLGAEEAAQPHQHPGLLRDRVEGGKQEQAPGAVEQIVQEPRLRLERGDGAVGVPIGRDAKRGAEGGAGQRGKVWVHHLANYPGASVDYSSFDPGGHDRDETQRTGIPFLREPRHSAPEPITLGPPGRRKEPDEPVTKGGTGASARG